MKKEFILLFGVNSFYLFGNNYLEFIFVPNLLTLKYFGENALEKGQYYK